MIDWKGAARHYRTLYSEAVERGCRDRDFWRARTFTVEREGAEHRREMQADLLNALAERDAALEAHARCTNLSNAEASRIFEEARQMREERDAARREAERLRAYALALRGDLVEIDAALSEGELPDDGVVSRHMRGTLDEDAAALASERTTEAPHT